MTAGAPSSLPDFRILFESAPAAQVVVTGEPDFLVVAVSDAYLRATMTAREEIVGRSLPDVVEAFSAGSAAAADALRESLRAVARTGQAQFMPVQRLDVRRPDGTPEPRYLNPINTPVFAADGRLSHVVHKVQDVTELVRLRDLGEEQERRATALQARTVEMAREAAERAEVVAETERRRELAFVSLVQAQQALRQMEDRLRQFARSSVIGIVFGTLDGAVTDCNDEYLRIAGYTRAEFERLGLRWDTLTAPEFTEADRRAIDEAKRTGSCAPFEKQYARRDGSRVWVLVGLTLIGEAKRETVAFVLDVSRQKQIEQANQQLAAMVQASREAMFGLTLDGVVDSWNPAAEALFGYAPDEIIGREVRALVPPDRAGEPAELFGRVRRGVPTDELETVRLRKDGTPVEVSLTLSPIFENGVVVRAAATVRDITERRRAAQSLQDREARLRALTERLQFLNRLSDLARNNNDPERVMEVVARELGGHLKASRCAYADVGPDGERFTIRHDYTDGCASTVGTYHLSLFGPRTAGDQRAGRTLVIHDVDAELSPGHGGDMFRSIDIRAVVCCPLLKQGRLVAMMAVHQTAPRRWSDEEVDLVREVVERSWAYIERARVGRDLRASEARFRQLADNLPQLAWMARPDGSIFWFNRRVYEFTGARPEEIEEWSWRSRIHPDHLDRMLASFKAAVSAGGPWEDLFPLRREDGAYRWMLSRAVPLRDADRRIILWFGTNTDVTDQREAEEKVRRSERQLRDLADSQPSIVWAARPDGEIDYFNERWYEYTGAPRSQFGTTSWVNVVHPEDLPRTLETAEATVRSAGVVPYEIEYRLRGKDGEYRWFLGRAVPARDEAGGVVRYYGTCTDITLRRETEAALRASEADFRRLIERAPDPVFVADRDYVYTDVNDAACELLGYRREELVGMRVPDLCRPEDAAMLDRVRAAVAADLDYRQQWDLRHRDGGFIPTDISMRVLQGGRWLMFVRDARERLAHERQRAAVLDAERAARAEAERASRMKDEFLATLSHELRTPLNAILGWSSLLKRHPAGKAGDVGEGLEIIERNARAQASIIEDLLDMSRITSGKVRLEVRPVSLPGVVNGALETVRPAADAKGIRLEAEFDPSADAPVAGDPNRLQQVFWNLLSNAIKFTPRGGTVRVRLARAESHVRAQVSDTGQGIPPEFLPFVFDRFRQADASTTRQFGGLGLGLAIVRHLTELHGGTVRVDSPGEGRGSTFTVLLPAGPPPAPAAAGSEPQGAAQKALPPSDDPGLKLEGVRVLVVDDESDARQFVRRLLEDCGATVRTAGSAAEAMHAIRDDGRPDVLVSDIGMPVEDGYSLIRRVRSLPPGGGGDVPAVALTAYARAEDRARATAAGYEVHVAKPVEPAALIETVARLARPRGRDGSGDRPGDHAGKNGS